MYAHVIALLPFYENLLPYLGCFVTYDSVCLTFLCFSFGFGKEEKSFSSFQQPIIFILQKMMLEATMVDRYASVR